MAKDIGLVEINQRSGYCRSNFTLYSKRNPEPLPSNTVLDVTTFISSHANHRNKIAFIDASTGHHISFSEVWEAIDSVASSLYDMGIRKGDVVLILSPNSIFFPIVTNSVMSLGAVITTSNPLNTKHEINKQIVDLKPVLAFTTSELLPKLADSNLPIILIGTSSEYTDFKSKKLKIVHFLDEIMNRKQQSLIQVKERVTQDDTASLLYSSGTTGVSKGVITTHRNFIAMISTALKQFKRDEREQIYICILPMFHIYGLGAFCMTLLASGSTVVILSKKFEIQQMLSAIEKYKVSYLPLVPPVLVEMVNNADRMKEEYDLRSLEWVVCGGAPLSKEVTEMFLQKYPGVVVLQGYGMTETAGMGASTVLAEESLKYGTAGMLAVYMEAMVVEPGSGKAVAENRLGELWLKGPTVMKGYFNNPEATASTLDLDGWLRTGDLCYIDEDGFVFVVDRLKELIKYKGYQVLPAELEALLLTHPEIDDCAVIPFPDKDVGQFPMAYIVRKTGSNLSDNAVMDFISKQVAPYKRIRQVTFIGSIPKNPSGKKLRKNLIRLATSKL